MFIHELASVVEWLQRTVRCSVIKDSFAKGGIYAYSPNVILAKCIEDISVEESLHIILGVMPDLANILLSKGKILESDYDNFGVTITKIPHFAYMFFGLWPWLCWTVILQPFDKSMMPFVVVAKRFLIIGA